MRAEPGDSGRDETADDGVGGGVVGRDSEQRGCTASDDGGRLSKSWLVYPRESPPCYQCASGQRRIQADAWGAVLATRGGLCVGGGGGSEAAEKAAAAVVEVEQAVVVVVVVLERSEGAAAAVAAAPHWVEAKRGEQEQWKKSGCVC